MARDGEDTLGSGKNDSVVVDSQFGCDGETWLFSQQLGPGVGPFSFFWVGYPFYS